MSWSVAIVICVGMLCMTIIIVSILDVIREKYKKGAEK